MAATVAVVGTLPPLPTHSPLQHPPSATGDLLSQDRRVYEGRELPAALRDALQPWLDAERQRLNATQTQPVITALIPQQVVIAEEWALVLLRQENRYTDRATPETSTTALLSVRYLQRQVDTATWQMVTQESVPGAVQAALWGPQEEQCLPGLCVRYRPFGLPSLGKTLATLDGELAALAANYGVSAHLPSTVTVTIEPYGSVMWQAASLPKSFPLVSTGLWEETFVNDSATMRQGIVEALTDYLVTSLGGQQQDNRLDPATGGVVPIATPDLAGLDPLPWLDFSPDGTWTVAGLTAIPTQIGDQYYTEMRVSQVAGDLTWTPIAAWQPFGLGYTTPRIVHWSADGRYLYYTNAPHPDGCGLFVNASDLQRLDLTDGTVQELLPPNATWVLAAAPDGTIAYIDQTTLVIYNPNDDTRREVILDFAQSNMQLGNLVWSPDSQQLVLTVAYDPCLLPDWRNALYTVDRQGYGLHMILPPDERRFQSTAWLDNNNLLLIDFDNQQWVLDVASGELQEQGTIVVASIEEGIAAAQRFVEQVGGDNTLPISFVSIWTTPYRTGRVYQLASAAQVFAVNVNSGAVVEYGPSPSAKSAEIATTLPRKPVDELAAIARQLVDAQNLGIDLDRFTPHHSNKEELVYFFRWEDTSRMIDGMPLFIQVALSASGDVVSYMNTVSLVAP
ncbi:MAG: hypothetical protein R2867_21225 [Caldilineaceae bacterium]